MTGWAEYDEWEARDRTLLEALAEQRDRDTLACDRTVRYRSTLPDEDAPVNDFAKLARNLPHAGLALGLDAVPGARAAYQRAESEETLDAIARANGITRDELDQRIRRMPEQRAS